MGIDGARDLSDVTETAWITFAGDARFRPAFVTKTIVDLLERAKHESATLLADPDHRNETARQIAARVEELELR